MSDLNPRTIIIAAKARAGTLVFDSNGEGKDTPVDAAVRFSISIPFFFTPGKHQHEDIFDGGCLANFPFEICQSRINDEFPLIGLYLKKSTDQKPMRWDFLKPFRVLASVLEIVTDQDDPEIARKFDKQIAFIDPSPIGILDLDLSRAERDHLEKRGRLAALEFLVEKKGKADAKPRLETLKKNVEKSLQSATEHREKRRKNYYVRMGTLLTLLCIAVLADIAIILSGFFLQQQSIQTPSKPGNTFVPTRNVYWCFTHSPEKPIVREGPLPEKRQVPVIGEKQSRTNVQEMPAINVWEFCETAMGGLGATTEVVQEYYSRIENTFASLLLPRPITGHAPSTKEITLPRMDIAFIQGEKALIKFVRLQIPEGAKNLPFRSTTGKQTQDNNALIPPKLSSSVLGDFQMKEVKFNRYGIADLSSAIGTDLYCVTRYPGDHLLLHDYSPIAIQIADYCGECDELNLLIGGPIFEQLEIEKWYSVDRGCDGNLVFGEIEGREEESYSFEDVFKPVLGLIRANPTVFYDVAQIAENPKPSKAYVSSDISKNLILKGSSQRIVEPN